MNIPTLTHIEAFRIYGEKARTSNKLEFDPSSARIGSLWSTLLMRSPLYKDAAVYGIYSEYESDQNGMYTVTVGYEMDDESLWRSLGMPVEEGKYLCFKFEGAMPQACIDGWKYVWSYFEKPDCPYKRRFVSDFEKYPSQGVVEIYIGVEP